VKQVGEFALALELAQFLDKEVGPVGIGRGQREVGVGRMSIGLQRLEAGLRCEWDFAVSGLVLAVEVGPGYSLRSVVLLADKLAVVPQRLPMSQSVVPKEAGNRKGKGIVAVVGVAASEAAEPLFQVIGDVGGSGPGMAIGAEHAAAVEIVEQREFPCQGVMVGRHFFSEQHQAWIAVALLQVAE